mgnify:CR=1 FL=1
MICLRCGYCCKHSFVVVIADPDKGYDEDNPDESNVLMLNGDGTPCPYLKGDRPGEYFCAVHDKEWYDKTLCYAHNQIEEKDSFCRIGEYMIKKLENGDTP